MLGKKRIRNTTMNLINATKKDNFNIVKIQNEKYVEFQSAIDWFKTGVRLKSNPLLFPVVLDESIKDTKIKINSTQ